MWWWSWELALKIFNVLLMFLLRFISFIGHALGSSYGAVYYCVL